jgi:sRNA-binding regulator protein Hfq
MGRPRRPRVGRPCDDTMMKDNDRGKRPGGKPPMKGGGGGKSSRAPEQTYEEVRYLKRLIDDETPVCVKLRDNSEIHGVIEYYDHSFIRVTRHNEPNLFIFKHEIKYLHEE